ncbi:MAG: hypothetical protein R3200_03890 [Xanthomonadales bacterium]|nr:hypothetical protein [Xanthomonadales bacterium]
MPSSNLPEKIAVITGDPSCPDPTKLNQRYGPEDLEVHARMRKAFEGIDGLTSRVFESHASLFDDLREFQPDLVVNFCDTGLFNRPDQEIHVVTQLELMGLPYTGAPPRAMLLCYDKQVVRLVAEALGVSVPAEQFVPAGGVANAQVERFPALIKPNTADGSVGITKDAVVHDAGEASDYLGWLAEELPDRDVLIQEYLPGPEYGLGMIGNPETGDLLPLPMLEVDFSGLPEGLAPILSFESKAEPESPYWTDIRFRATQLPDMTRESLIDAGRRLFRRLSLRDYGRFDYRTAADGTIRLMEVNPNPAWGWDAKMALMADVAGWTYQQLLERLVATAWARVRADH